MATVAGTVMLGIGDQFGPSAARAKPSGHVQRDSPPANPTPQAISLLADNPSGTIVRIGVPMVPFPVGTQRGSVMKGPHDPFFEQTVVLPRRIDLGIVLAPTTVDIEVYNSRRATQVTWFSYVNGSGDGVSIPDLPALPKTLNALQGSLQTFTVEVEGPPSIGGTQDFTFAGGVMVSIPVSGARSIVFPFVPESPVLETLQFLTDVLRSSGGFEQRRALRRTPRSFFEFETRTKGRARRQLEAYLFGAQDRIVGLPHWHEPAIMTAPVAISATSATVDATAYAQFRVGKTALLIRDSLYYESLQIASIGATSLTFSTPATKAFPTGSLVLPLVAAIMQSTVRQNRFRTVVQSNSFRFRVVDNDLDLSSAAAFPTLFGKVLLDEPNAIRGQIDETWARRLNIVDSGIGPPKQSTREAVSTHGTSKGWVSNSRQRLWEIRGLLHAVRGRQVSFYQPTFFDDLLPVDQILSGGSTIDVENVGYTRYVQSRGPRNVIRLNLTDGTKVSRLVTSSTELSAEIERLTISGTWGVNAQVEDVERIDYVELTRLDTDDVTIEHQYSHGVARVFAPTRAVRQ